MGGKVWEGRAGRGEVVKKLTKRATGGTGQDVKTVNCLIKGNGMKSIRRCDWRMEEVGGGVVVRGRRKSERSEQTAAPEKACVCVCVCV